MSEASLFERDLYVEVTIAWYQTQGQPSGSAGFPDDAINPPRMRAVGRGSLRE